MGGASDEGEVLLRQRAVELQLVIDGGDSLLRSLAPEHDPHWVSGNEVDEDEGGERDPDDHGRRVHKPPA